MYGKIFASMFEGSLYGNWRAIVVLQQLIVLCDADGVIDMTPQAIAARTSIPLDIIQAGLEALQQPDPQSRTPDEGGCRIRLLDPDHRAWGWYIVNHAKYRGLRDNDEVRAKNRDRKRRQREREQSHDVTECHAESRQTDAKADTKTSKIGQQADRFPEFWEAFGKKVKKQDALEVWKSRRLDQIADRIITDVETRKVKDGRWLDGYQPDAVTYLRGTRWEDDFSPSTRPSSRRPVEAIKPKTDAEREADRKREADAFELTNARHEQVRYGLDPQAVGESDAVFIQRIRREATNKMLGRAD